MHHITVSSVQDAKGFLLSHFLISIHGLSRLGFLAVQFQCVEAVGHLISRRFPAEFIGISGGFIGEKKAEHFKWNRRGFSGEIIGNLQRNQGEI